MCEHLGVRMCEHLGVSALTGKRVKESQCVNTLVSECESEYVSTF